jgi:hypothetical protein
MTDTPSQAPDKAGLLDRAREARRRFGQQSAEQLEIARACATAAHEDYSDFDALTFDRFKKDGIWNDDVAVQSALAALQMAEALSPPPVVEEAGLRDALEGAEEALGLLFHDYEPGTLTLQHRAWNAVRRALGLSEFAYPVAPTPTAGEAETLIDPASPVFADPKTMARAVLVNLSSDDDEEEQIALIADYIELAQKAAVKLATGHDGEAIERAISEAIGFRQRDSFTEHNRGFNAGLEAAKVVTLQALATLPSQGLTIPDELRELSERATEGPWEAVESDSTKYLSVVQFRYQSGGAGTVALVGQQDAIVGTSELDRQNASALLIAAAVNFIRQALASPEEGDSISPEERT